MILKSKKTQKYCTLVYNKVSQFHEIGETKGIAEFVSDKATLAIMAWIGYVVFTEDSYKQAIRVLKETVNNYARSRGCDFEGREAFREFVANVLNTIHQISMGPDIENPEQIIPAQIDVILHFLELEYSEEIYKTILEFFLSVLMEVDEFE